MNIVVLIDFDNLFGGDIGKIFPEQMEMKFKEILRLCETEFDEFNTVQIRLYGGWYREMTLTKFASEIQQILRNVNVFPKVSSSGILNGTIELATSLHYEPNFVWAYTHKETQGIKRIRINHDSVDLVCKNNKVQCPKFLLYKFTEKKEKKCYIEGCENLQRDVFKGAEQKMVDTLIACDIISSSEDEQVSGVLVISDDQDHLPALALASFKKNTNVQSILLAIQNEQVMEFVSDFMEPYNIKPILLT